MSFVWWATIVVSTRRFMSATWGSECRVCDINLIDWEAPAAFRFVAACI